MNETLTITRIWRYLYESKYAFQKVISFKKYTKWKYDLGKKYWVRGAERGKLADITYIAKS